MSDVLTIFGVGMAGVFIGMALLYCAIRVMGRLSKMLNNTGTPEKDSS